VERIFEMMFQKATKRQSRLRMAMIGPSGSGKTYSALNVAQFIGKRVALIDTERGSASKYAHRFNFDVVELESFEPEKYIEAIREAERAGYDVLIIDSLSHAWAGKGGILEFVDTETKKSTSHNAYTEGWRKATPKHNELVDSLLQNKLHIIATMRSKTEYVMEKDEKTGKTYPRKVGLQPVQRDGLEYEFDVVGDMNQDNEYIISKTRCEDLSRKVIEKPGKNLAEILVTWLTVGEPPATPQEAPKEQPKPQPVPETPKQPTSADRPLAPDALKAYFNKVIGEFPTFTPTEKQIKLLRHGMELLFAGDDAVDEKRHTVLFFLTGEVSTNDVKGNQLKAFIERWLKMKQDSGGEWNVDPMAIREAALIIEKELQG